MNVHAQRLLNVARALREAERPDRFDMGSYGNFCGTPACALGHYAARKDLQRSFELSFFRGFLRYRGESADYNAPEVCNHFGITRSEAGELFAADGCNDAQFPGEAATFIEAFVAKKWPQARDPGVVKLVRSLEKAVS